MFATRRCALLAGALFLVGGCGGAEEPPAIARVGDWTLTARDLERAVEQGDSRFASPEQRRAYVERRVERAVLAENARRAGYADSPEVQEAIERVLVAQFVEDELEQRLRRVTVEPAEVDAHYRANLPRFTTPEQVRIAAILIPVHPNASPSSRQSKREKAEAALEAVKEAQAAGSASRSFGALAVRFSEDQVSRYRGGDLGWIDRRTPGSAKAEWNPELAAAALALETPGELTPILETRAGFAIAKFMDRRPEVTQPFEDVQEGIRAGLLRERQQAVRAAFTDEMHAAVEVEIDDALLAALAPPEESSLPRSEPRPPGLPGGAGE